MLEIRYPPGRNERARLRFVNMLLRCYDDAYRSSTSVNRNDILQTLAKMWSGLVWSGIHSKVVVEGRHTLRYLT